MLWTSFSWNESQTLLAPTVCCVTLYNESLSWLYSPQSHPFKGALNSLSSFSIHLIHMRTRTSLTYTVRHRSWLDCVPLKVWAYVARYHWSLSQILVTGLNSTTGLLADWLVDINMQPLFKKKSWLHINTTTSSLYTEKQMLPLLAPDRPRWQHTPRLLQSCFWVSSYYWFTAVTFRALLLDRTGVTPFYHTLFVKVGVHLRPVSSQQLLSLLLAHCGCFRFHDLRGFQKLTQHTSPYIHPA